MNEELKKKLQEIFDSIDSEMPESSTELVLEMSVQRARINGLDVDVDDILEAISTDTNEN
jgi:hypothetical protein